jgi:outer membrane protein OmpA-like peptidoglycan-associated protein
MKKISVILLSLLLGVASVFAQTDNQTRSVASGQKMKIQGVVVSKDADKIVVRDMTGVDTSIALTPSTSIKTNGGFLKSGKTIPTQSIVRGLNLEVEGRGDGTNLVAEKIRFSKENLAVAQSIESRVAPAEGRLSQSEERLTQAEQNAQRVSGQIDELMAVSNAARGGAKAAQDSADAAIAGVNATNTRINSLDDYVVQSTSTVNFRVNSAILSPESKASLDQVAQAAMTMKGYVIEITGFASAEGGAAKNKALSQKRAQAVIDYLVETHNVPLRRIGTSYGFGALQPVADNTTREGREQNRRVEVKLLASRGINQNVEVRNAQPNPNPNPTN